MFYFIGDVLRISAIKPWIMSGIYVIRNASDMVLYLQELRLKYDLLNYLINRIFIHLIPSHTTNRLVRKIKQRIKKRIKVITTQTFKFDAGLLFKHSLFGIFL